MMIGYICYLSLHILCVDSHIQNANPLSTKHFIISITMYENIYLIIKTYPVQYLNEAPFYYLFPLLYHKTFMKFHKLMNIFVYQNIAKIVFLI